MRTFSELLREYTGRTGVSDAELARAVGVQRQTVFRWKEGAVARPRSAEDVLRLAEKLRLTAAERDELLLAAGFPPVTPVGPVTAVEDVRAPAAPAKIAPGTPSSDLEVALAEPATAGPPASVRRRGVPWAAVAVATLLLFVGAVSIALWQQARYPRASEGERLIVVAQFGNYTGGAQGYNVPGRLKEALERELAAAGLKDARVAVWPSAVTDERAAARALERSQAALLIWGEYDSGRVVARILPAADLADPAREVSLQAATPAELPTVINSTLPGDIRYLALYTLAQVYLHAHKPVVARAALEQAGLHLPEEALTQAAHYFLRGYANQIMQPPDLDAAIDGYTRALQQDERLEGAHNNRGLAYLRRRGGGDLAAAAEDFTRYLAEHPDDAAAYNNRGGAYLSLGGSDNLQRALADFDRAIALAPEDSAGYYNRGLVYVRLDDGPKWQADLQRALEAGHKGAYEGLCWGFSLSEEPALAVEHCQAALEAGATGAWENLAVAYARTGQYEAAASALASYRDALAKASTVLSPTKGAQIDAWLAALDAKQDPFDTEAMRAE